jgi:hypothetical protein
MQDLGLRMYTHAPAITVQHQAADFVVQEVPPIPSGGHAPLLVVPAVVVVEVQAVAVAVQHQAAGLVAQKLEVAAVSCPICGA